MEDKVKKFLIGLYFFVLISFPVYLIYLFAKSETASFSLFSKVFIGFLFLVNLVLIVLLFSKRFRNIFLLE